MQQAQVLSEQRRLMEHRPAPDTVAFDSDTDRSAMLLEDKTTYRTPTKLQWNTPEHARLGQKRWRPLAFYLPQSIAQLCPNPSSADGIVFLHRRRTKEGHERLVTVWIKLGAVFGERDYYLHVIAAAHAPATWQPGSTLTYVPASRFRWQHNPIFHPLRLYAGQPDPQDPSHFTIRYELGRGSGTIDGWLRGPDQEHATEHVVLDARDGPFHEVHGL